MALSASPILKLGAVAAFSICLSGTLVACTTTQQTAARLKVSSSRTLADHTPISVTTPAPGIEVLSTGIVQGTNGTAIAVDVQNTGTKPVNDLPLSLTGQEGGKPVDINGKKPSSYINAHAPALAPGEQATWVFVSKKKVPVTGPVVAKVGVPTDPPITTADEVPILEVSPATTAPSKGVTAVTTQVKNPSDFSQVNVPVYAWAKQGNRFVAAGQAVIPKISGGSTAPVTIKLIGDPGANTVQVFAPATIFK